MRRRLLNIKRGGSSGGFDFTSDLMGYWKLATNSLDSSGRGHNGTDTNMTYAGGYAQFGTGYIQVADSDDFSFTDGVNDISAHFLISFILNDKSGIQIYVTKRVGDTLEWQISSNGSDLSIILYSTTISNLIRIDIPLSSINTGVLNTVQFAYNGNKSHTGLSAYLNGNNQVGTSLTGGSYVGMINTAYVIQFGSYNTTLKLKADAKEWAIWKGRTMTPEEITEIDRRVKAGEPLI